MRSPGLEGLWQLHFVMKNDHDHNTGEEQVANLSAPLLLDEELLIISRAITFERRSHLETLL